MLSLLFAYMLQTLACLKFKTSYRASALKTLKINLLKKLNKLFLYSILKTVIDTIV